MKPAAPPKSEIFYVSIRERKMEGLGYFLQSNTIIMRWIRWILFLVAGLHVASASTDTEDVAALRSLMSHWQNIPPSWGKTDDPCGTPWEGVSCRNSRITALSLSTMGLKGTLSGDIGQFTELTTLDLSYNKELTGPLSPRIGDLQKLNILILAGCGFTGTIPTEIGNLAKLTFLALNSNNFIGGIPPSLGSLSQLYWLDLADNQLTGSLPVSDNNSPGLDLLLKAKHFHFNKNKLSGAIPSKLFSSEMVLIHVLFDGNQLNGSIPSTLGLVKTLEALRLDRNSLTGPVPSNLNNLTSLNELNLAYNKLTGSVPDLSGMGSLNYVDLSNNTFDKAEAPRWFSTIGSLTTLVMEYGQLEGSVPSNLFSLPQIQQVKLRNNAFNNTLDMGNNIGQQLQFVDLQNNNIQSVNRSGYSNTLILVGNPVCTITTNDNYCQLRGTGQAYSTDLTICSSKSCPPQQSVNPQSCDCAYPYTGILIFRAPTFRELSNAAMFHSLEMSLWVNLSLAPGSVSLQSIFFNKDDYLQMQLELFPSNGKYFNRTEVQRIGFYLSNQVYKPSDIFGPYLFNAFFYPFPDGSQGTSLSSGAIAGIAISCVALVFLLMGVGIYAIRQKKRADKATELSKPFASLFQMNSDNGGAPKLKGARLFSYDELRACTSNFSESNEIGSGGYGKVYKGIISSGQVVAIKRATQGSMQGGHEFRNEIELLSRVHHKNLVNLVGFCLEQKEQMLVYEFIPNGTLWESLSGRSGIHLDWKRRLQIALDSARGLSYLHEHANPPIIHRDVKSSNILLDENLVAKVSDFGLSKLISDISKGHVSTQVKGTVGYLDPEYYMTQQLTEKSDVYSFGIVMLELVTAKKPIEKGKYIVREVRMIIDENDKENNGLKEIIDLNIKNDAKLFGLVRFVELAMRCVEESATNRPTMSYLVKEIESILQNEGQNTNSTYASSSVTHLPRHHIDVLSEDDFNKSDAFEYSGGFMFPAKIEPM
ncbi:PREDICTED: probable leucine-rich repeat receptor-like protein kinase At5g49770 [Nelumbo nucifera]|uniref:non-specific serine/threonine protein kinase n=1 Tax=Nelumbo nucifera TaxID=4432 RepID=A0A1U7ZTH9_NELNU|nr:PREDICTED: probable leucine-rich repeat receptor-like protein kinase At5g49770 [Nelumbo nucifera]